MVGFGAWIWQSVTISYRMWVLGQPLPQAWLTNAALLRLGGFELIAVAVISVIACARGWSFKAFGWCISWRLTGVALALFACGVLVYFFLPLGLHFRGRVSLWALVPTMAVNAFYEESLEVGYVFRVFGRFGVWPAVLASALLRGGIHLYAGLPAVLAIFAAGVLAGLIYWRTKSLWPLFLAHLLDDLLVLIPLVKM